MGSTTLPFKLALHQILPAGRIVSFFFLISTLITTISVACLSLGSMVLTGYANHIERSICHIFASVTVNRYSTDSFIGKAPIDQSDQDAILMEVNHVPGLVAARGYQQNSLSVTIKHGHNSTTKRIFLMGRGRGIGTATMPFLENAELVFDKKIEGDLPPIILSKNLIPGLSIGDHIEIESDQATEEFAVAGLCDTGIIPIFMVIADLSSASRISGRTADPDSFQLRLRNSSDAERISKSLQEALKGKTRSKLITSSWNKTFVSYLSLVNGFKYLVLSILSCMAFMSAIFSFCVFEIIMTRRRRESAILMAIGVTNNQIRQSFILISIGIAFSAFIGGAVVSLAAGWIISNVPLLQLQSITGLAHFPISVSLVDHLLIWSVVGTSLVLSAVLAERKASQTTISEDLRR